MPLPFGNGTGSTNSHYTHDGLGSVIALTDSTGNTDTAVYTYDPYGTILSGTGSQATLNPWRYASGYHDAATGLTKFGTRYYNPSLGRWTQRDPIAGTIDNPSAVNRYPYVGSNPSNLVDPSGRIGCWFFCFSVKSTAYQTVTQNPTLTTPQPFSADDLRVCAIYGGAGVVAAIATGGGAAAWGVTACAAIILDRKTAGLTQ